MGIDLDPSDAELLLRSQQGSFDAYSCLYERYLPIILRRVCYLVPREDAEDVTQEIFISVMKSLKNFRGESSFFTWLRTITNREIANYYRRRGVAGKLSDIDLTSYEAELLPQMAEGSPAGEIEDVLTVKQVLNRLPDKYREIILMRFAEDMQFNEIAVALHQTLEGVKSLFRRAMAAFEKEANEAHVKHRTY